jgi:hypothetical protein
MIQINSCTIPTAVQIVFDDVGWWSGTNDSKIGGPSRTSMPRRHCLADYKAIALLGQRLGMKPQCPFVIGEWDQANILREVEGSTWMREKWDNPWKNHHELESAAALIRENNHKTFEVALHALGHEFWTATGVERTEWHNPQCDPRTAHWKPHLAAWRAIWEQNDFGPFWIDAFVPCAGRHRFGSGFAGLLYEMGVRWINTPFTVMRQERGLNHKSFDIDQGVFTIDRSEDVAPWNKLATPPTPGHRQPYLGAHWTNVLHENPDKNEEAVEAWVAAMQWYKNDRLTMLATSTAHASRQYIHQQLISAWCEKREVIIDATRLNRSWTPDLGDQFTLRLSMGQAPKAVAADSPFKLISAAPFQYDYYDVTVQRLDKRDTAVLAFV